VALGPDDAEDSIQGSAEEFCLVVTQRRHPSDTSLSTGELGTHWRSELRHSRAPSEGHDRESSMSLVEHIVNDSVMTITLNDETTSQRTE